MALFDQSRDPYYSGVSWLSSVWLFSSINVVLFFVGNVRFIVGLTMTDLLLSLPIFTLRTALILIVLLLGLLVGCWSMAKQGKEAGLLIGALIYLADLIALVAISILWSNLMIIDLIFHVLALVMMIRGFVYGVKAKAKVRSNWMMPAAQDEEADM